MKNVIKEYIPIIDDGKNLKQNILLEIENRFHDIERYKVLAISKILDPRFKKIYFEQARNVSFAVSYINNLMPVTNENINPNVSVKFGNDNQTNKLWQLHNNLAISAVASCDNPGGINVELRQYLNQPIIPRQNDPLKYWQTVKHAYPVLFKIAKKYLSVVATSVPSERLFSKAGIIKSESKNRLTPKRLNILLFLGSLNYEDWEFPIKF